MKYLLLPIHLIKFWYPESLFILIRTWKNTILWLEEDLALGLMVKLLFVPLFHDSSWVGRILSFIFRIIRIILALFAFLLATLLIIIGAIYWFGLPLLVIFDWPVSELRPVNLAILLAGAGLFVLHILAHPHKKVWQISPTGNLWQASLIKKKDLRMEYLLNQHAVELLLATLELPKEVFAGISLNPDEAGAEALELAKRSGVRYISPRHFFVAALKISPGVDNLLAKFELNVDDLLEALRFQDKKTLQWRKVWLWDDDFVIHHLRGVNRGWLGSPTPTLDAVSIDMTRQIAKKGASDFLGRSTVVSEVVNILSQEQGRNVILVGQAGAGKTTLIEFLAKQILMGDAPAALAIKRLVVLDITRLLAGIENQGQLADRIKKIFEEVTFSKNIILGLEEVHALGLGEAGGDLNLYSLLLPFIESSDFQFIATTEPQQYARVIEKDSSFARLFTKIELPPSDILDTVQILEDRAISMERYQKKQVTFRAIKKTVELSSRLIHDRVLPDSALAVLEEAKILTKDVINMVVVEQAVSKRVNVPVMETGQVKQELLNLEQEIHKSLIDQDEAVKAVSDALRRSAAGLREGTRPIGSFLFVGPTGVGKTELSKILAKIYFKDEEAFIRFDMSEYQTSEASQKLIGQNGQPGQLTEAVKNRPYALVLLDEFEKASPEILTLFLQVLDDGRLTDGTGKTVDFTNTIIIATSNVASLLIAQGLEKGLALGEIDKSVNQELLKIFKPELINRFDDIVLFKPLSNSDLQKIVALKLSDLQKQLKEQGFMVEFDGVLINELAKKGFDPVLGARPLRRLIQDTLEAKLSRLILENKLPKGKPIKAGLELLQET